MSSAGAGDRGVISGEPRLYFCHQCERTVPIPPPSGDLVCPNCNGGFLEELENPIPHPNPIHPFFSFATESPAAGTGFPLVFPGGAQPFDDLSTLFGNRSSPPFGGDNTDAFNPLAFLQNYVQTLTAGGANVQFVIENSGDPTGAFRIPSNVNHGDYFFGPGLEELIQQLAENDPNRRGTPPASKSAVEALPDVSVTEDLLASDLAQCAVCKDIFDLGDKAKQMPCKHIYHADCILPWLEMHNSCPVCRHELPTDDQDYEQRAGRRGPPTDTSGGGRGGDSSQRRGFRVSLPWPFRQTSTSAAGTSNVGNANNNSNNSSGNNSGQSNTESRGNQNFESETRQEDLD